jgi:potassium-transporting ATPase KdpC subunit
MKTQTLIALKIILVMTVITGLMYPFFITGISQVFMYRKANGSLIRQNDLIIGSELIGQVFDSSTYFWSRPSTIGYCPLPSGGSNLGPTSIKLKKLVEERRSIFASANGIEDRLQVPIEMITVSASGLDPHISPKAAIMQVDRVANARNFDDHQRSLLIRCIAKLTEKPQLSFLGNERVNVLLLNLELDKIK